MLMQLNLISQGQARVIIFINCDGPASLILHSKFHCNRPTGSGKEDFKVFLPYMGMAAILVM